MRTVRKFYLLILIFQIIWKVDSVPEKVDNERERRKYYNSTEARKGVKMFTDAYRLYNGTDTLVNSMCLLMRSDPFYRLIDDHYLLKFSPQCFVTAARSFVNHDNPPTIDTTHFYGGLCVRPDCGINYHPKEILLNSFPNYDPIKENYDIAIFKTYIEAVNNRKCGGPPLEPAWISCDRDGPPANYTDCFYASFGSKSFSQTNASVNAPINTVKVTTLAEPECLKYSNAGSSANLNFNRTNEICIIDENGLDPTCNDYFYNPFLFCKYWDRDSGHPSNDWGSNGGWKHETKSAGSDDNGSGWNMPAKQNLLAVGHYQQYWGDYCGNGSKGANILVKYGAEIYRSLFSKCGYYCSSELKRGYRCSGNPPKSLGPVYCFPEKILPTTNGWGV